MASSPRPWGRLELRRAAALRVEVDQALKGLEAAVENSEDDMVREYAGHIGARVEELEEFALEHEDDERRTGRKPNRNLPDARRGAARSYRTHSRRRRAPRRGIRTDWVRRIGGTQSG